MDDKFMPEENVLKPTEEATAEPTLSSTDVAFEEPKAQPAAADTPAPVAPEIQAPATPFIPTTPVAFNQANTPSVVPPVPSTTTATDTKKKSKKKRGSTGKIIFIFLICLAVIASSILVITNENVKDYLENPTSPDETVSTTEPVTTPEGEVVPPTLVDSPSATPEYSGTGPMTPEQVYNAVKDINVAVLVYSGGKIISEGSGIVYAKNSSNTHTYIVTAAHVIDGTGVKVTIKFNDGTETDAEIVGSDTKTDVGVLKVAGAKYKTAVIGSSDSLAVGQTVYAIGNPGGIEFFGSFTNGIISAIDRPVPSTSSTYDLPCIQHNAAINPGNSGGALVNAYGQVIGLNSSKISSTEYEGMGFAVPSKTVNEVYTELVKNGYVTNRPKLGIQYETISGNRSYLEIIWKNDLPQGSVIIASINADSDLASKDIQVGDVITAVNGKKLETTNVLLETIEKAKVNDTLTLTIYRFNSNGTVNKSFNVSVKLVEDKGTTSTGAPTTTEPETYFDPFSFFFGY